MFWHTVVHTLENLHPIIKEASEAIAKIDPVQQSGDVIEVWHEVVSQVEKTDPIIKVASKILAEHDPFQQSTSDEKCGDGIEGLIKIKLPYVEPQQTEYDCGPNSGSRLLQYHRYDASYNAVAQVRDAHFSSIEHLVKATCLGTTPHTLKSILEHWAAGRVHLEKESQVETLQHQLLKERPVICLVRTGSSKVLEFTIPVLHWIVVTGFNSQLRKFYYVDTDAEEKEISYDDFLSSGTGNYCWNWTIGHGLARVTLEQNGVLKRTMLWTE